MYNVPFNNFHYFKLCKSIPDRHPIAKKDDLSDGPKICTVYKHIFEIKKKKKKKRHSIHGYLLQTGIKPTGMP